MIRGNHETRNTSQQYGFYIECQKKFKSIEPWEHFSDMFDCLPIVAVVDNAVFCVHGGLSPEIQALD